MKMNSFLKWLMGFVVILFILCLVGYGMIFGFKEGDITMYILGGVMPVLTLVIQFFFRKSGNAENAEREG